MSRKKTYAVFALCGALSANMARGAPAVVPPDSPQISRVNVLVDVHVDKTGHATRATIAQSSGSDDADTRALAAVKQWHFNPALIHGTPTDANVRVPVVVESNPAKSAATSP